MLGKITNIFHQVRKTVNVSKQTSALQDLLEQSTDMNFLYTDKDAYFNRALAFVRQGADPNVSTQTKLKDFFKKNPGYTLLHQAALVGHTRAVQELAPLVNPNNLTKDKETPLHLAARCGQAEALHILLNTKRFDINAVNRFGMTPLYEAIRNKERDTIWLLLQHGARTDWLTPKGENAFDLAQKYGNADLFPKRQPTKPVSEQQEQPHSEEPPKPAVPPEIEALNKQMKKHVMSFNDVYKNPDNREKNLQNYFEKGADLMRRGAAQDFFDPDGESLLDQAIYTKNQDFMNIVISVPGFQINEPNKKGQYPLHVAVNYYPEGIPLLLEKGADPELLDKHGHTALQNAFDQGSDARLYLEGKKKSKEMSIQDRLKNLQQTTNDAFQESRARMDALINKNKKSL